MVELGIFACLLAVGYFFGTAREKSHYDSLMLRERQMLKMSVIADEKVHGEISDAFLVTGEVVIASDYFKNFAATLKNIFGGRLSSYESLMDRGRREAILRLKEQARKGGATEVVGLRLMMTSIDQLGIEVLATGTAVKRPQLERSL